MKKIKDDVNLTIDDPAIDKEQLEKLLTDNGIQYIVNDNSIVIQAGIGNLQKLGNSLKHLKQFLGDNKMRRKNNPMAESLRNFKPSRTKRLREMIEQEEVNVKNKLKKISINEADFDDDDFDETPDDETLASDLGSTDETDDFTDVDLNEPNAIEEPDEFDTDNILRLGGVTPDNGSSSPGYEAVSGAIETIRSNATEIKISEHQKVIDELSSLIDYIRGL